MNYERKMIWSPSISILKNYPSMKKKCWGCLCTG